MKKFVWLLALALVVAGLLVVGCDKQTPDAAQGAAPFSDFRSIRAQNIVSSGQVAVAVPTSWQTATPVVVIDSAAGLGNPFEIRKSGTPVFYVDVDGNAVYTGFTSAGGLVAAAAGVRAPTAVGTATPAFFVDSTGGVSNPFEVRYSATPVAVVGSGGALTVSGLMTGAGVSSSASGYFAVPTAVGTATPALFVNSAGGVSVPFEVRYSSTPVFVVSTTGGVTASSLAASAGLVAEDLYISDDGYVLDGFRAAGDLVGNTLTTTSTMTIGGMATFMRKTIAKTGVDIALTAAEVNNTFVSDLGDTGAITVTLPAAAAGMEVYLYNLTGNDWIVDCDNADQIFDLTNAAGNKVTNSTAYDYMHLVAVDATGWYPIDVHGTWTDAD